jgi:hypothetical protein
MAEVADAGAVWQNNLRVPNLHHPKAAGHGQSQQR